MPTYFSTGCSIINIFCAIAFGQRYAVDDEEFKEIMTFNNMIIEALAFGDPAAYVPLFRLLPNKNLAKLKEGVAIRDKVLSRKVDERKATYNPDVVRDFVDSLIKTSGDKSLFKDMDIDQVRREDNLDILLANMVIAGIS